MPHVAGRCSSPACWWRRLAQIGGLGLQALGPGLQRCLWQKLTRLLDRMSSGFAHRLGVRFGLADGDVDDDAQR